MEHQLGVQVWELNPGKKFQKRGKEAYYFFSCGGDSAKIIVSCKFIENN